MAGQLAGRENTHATQAMNLWLAWLNGSIIKLQSHSASILALRSAA